MLQESPTSLGLIFFISKMSELDQISTLSWILQLLHNCFRLQGSFREKRISIEKIHTQDSRAFSSLKKEATMCLSVDTLVIVLMFCVTLCLGRKRMEKKSPNFFCSHIVYALVNRNTHDTCARVMKKHQREDIS